MANKRQLALLKRALKAGDISIWNEWRAKNWYRTYVDLREADLEGASFGEALLDNADLRGANLTGVRLGGGHLSQANLVGAKISGSNLAKAQLSGADLSGVDLRHIRLREAILTKAKLVKANLEGADLIETDLSFADLTEAHLEGTSLHRANLRGAILKGAHLNGAHLFQTNLSDADLTEATLIDAGLAQATLVRTCLKRANLTGARVYGSSVWDVELEGAVQSNLILNLAEEPTITVDDLAVAQLIRLLLDRSNLTSVLTTLTSKSVLILGRFTRIRKQVLEGIAEELRKHNLVPIIFDFKPSQNRDTTETVKILAGLSLFVIIDLTSVRSVPQELMATAPDYQIPFVPIIQARATPYGMYADLVKKYRWVGKTVVKYSTKEQLLTNFEQVILAPALKRHEELKLARGAEVETRTITQILRDVAKG